MTWLVEHEPFIRLTCFAGVFNLMLWAEWRYPRRQQASPSTSQQASTQTSTHKRLPFISRRRSSNIALSLINTFVIRLLPALAAVGAANWAQSEHFGLVELFELNTDIGFWIGCVLAILALDMAIYCQHRIFHAVPWLWRLHRVHHSDTEFDTTTAIRFHPIEIVLSMIIKVALVILLGAPAEAVIIFEVILNAGALFNHANLSLPHRIDRLLRTLIVTPDMHRIHHSVHPEETNSNFGFSISTWDYLFGTYCTQPKDQHATMKIGLKEYQTEHVDELWPLLSQPFKSTR